MRRLYDEIIRRFPEVSDRLSEGDEELPYCAMGNLANWLKDLPKDTITPQLVDRLVSFARWCTKQPTGKDASDDIFSIYIVGFCEELFDSDTTRSLIPIFYSREDFITHANYLRAWVGAENYDKAGKYFEPAV